MGEMLTSLLRGCLCLDGVTKDILTMLQITTIPDSHLPVSFTHSPGLLFSQTVYHSVL